MNFKLLKTPLKFSNLGLMNKMGGDAKISNGALNAVENIQIIGRERNIAKTNTTE